jgi:diguanylate cyclase
MPAFSFRTQFRFHGAEDRYDLRVSPYRIDEEGSRPNGLRFVLRIHRMRMLGTFLCMLPIASVLLERSSPAPLWILLALNAFVWPQLALWAGRRARDPVATEFRSLVLDSAFGGAWVAAMAVSAAPAAVFVTLLTADKIAAGGWRLLVRSTGALLAGFAITWLLLDLPFQPQASSRTLLACLPFMLLYTVALSSLTHRLRGQIVVQNRELQRLARMDPVMQVPNRPHFEAVAALELSRFHRSGRPASMLLIDVDHFKAINDRHGHGVGDMVLKRIASVLRETVRDIDLPARYGGDEFAVVLVDTHPQIAVAIAERIRQGVAQQVIAGQPGLAVSLSIGVAGASRHHPRLDAWVQATDAALYRAKAAGRNQVCLARAEPGSAVPSVSDVLAA